MYWRYFGVLEAKKMRILHRIRNTTMPVGSWSAYDKKEDRSKAAANLSFILNIRYGAKHYGIGGQI
ncbi:MAG TPA: hypothetical protein DCK78_00020 [Paenibacillus lactis]|nr:hypothetical protein [Paenibacillus lactis]